MDNLPFCPQCNKNESVVKIVFGKPSQKLLLESEKGNVKLGGCCPQPGINYYCKVCDKSFGK